MFSIDEIIDIAIQLEKNGEALYRRAAAAHTDPAVISALNWLADEEAAHAETFSEMRAALKIEIEDPSLAEMGQRLFKQIVGGQGFSLTDEGLAAVASLDELMDQAVEFEKDTVIFYELLRAFIEDPQVLEQLDLIIEEEKRHVQEVQKILTEAT